MVKKAIMSLSLHSLKRVWFPSMLTDKKKKVEVLVLTVFPRWKQSEDKYRRGRGLLRDNCPAI